MFKNRSVQLKFVKDADEAHTDQDTKNPIVNDETAAIAKDIIKHVGVAIVAVSGSIITFKTLGQMAVIKTQAKAYKPTHKF
ncbi:hypothetical protein SEA_MEDIUMFRY_37 [Arthrobacter phage MediumFry]|nr:hypothetical protein SEA_MEDIUMFRY_37 [Arthrobacter phage MediumFry]